MPVTKEATEITLIGLMEILLAAHLISADSDLGFCFIAF